MFYLSKCHQNVTWVCRLSLRNQSDLSTRWDGNMTLKREREREREGERERERERWGGNQLGFCLCYLQTIPHIGFGLSVQIMLFVGSSQLCVSTVQTKPAPHYRDRKKVVFCFGKTSL